MAFPLFSHVQSPVKIQLDFSVLEWQNILCFFFFLFGCWLRERCTYKAGNCFVALTLLLPQLICFFALHLDKRHADFIKILCLLVNAFTFSDFLFPSPSSLKDLSALPHPPKIAPCVHNYCSLPWKLEFTAKYLLWLSGKDQYIIWLEAEACCDSSLQMKKSETNVPFF